MEEKVDADELGASHLSKLEFTCCLYRFSFLEFHFAAHGSVWAQTYLHEPGCLTDRPSVGFNIPLGVSNKPEHLLAFY